MVWCAEPFLVPHPSVMLSSRHGNDDVVVMMKLARRRNQLFACFCSTLSFAVLCSWTRSVLFVVVLTVFVLSDKSDTWF
jgi:hypothetical protein